MNTRHKKLNCWRTLCRNRYALNLQKQSRRHIFWAKMATNQPPAYTNQQVAYQQPAYQPPPQQQVVYAQTNQYQTQPAQPVIVQAYPAANGPVTNQPVVQYPVHRSCRSLLYYHLSSFFNVHQTDNGLSVRLWTLTDCDFACSDHVLRRLNITNELEMRVSNAMSSIPSHREPLHGDAENVDISMICSRTAALFCKSEMMADGLTLLLMEWICCGWRVGTGRCGRFFFYWLLALELYCCTHWRSDNRISNLYPVHICVWWQLFDEIGFRLWLFIVYFLIVSRKSVSWEWIIT